MLPYLIQIVQGGLITDEISQPDEATAIKEAERLLSQPDIQCEYIRVLTYLGEVIFQRCKV